MDTVTLRPFTLDDEPEALAAQAELAADDFTFLLGNWEPGEPWPGFLARLDRWSRGEDVPPGMVPSTFLAAQAQGTLVGRVSIRHELNDYLAEVGGHIGYGVRPAFRRRGYATQILRGSLALCRDLGLDSVLVTCDDDNVGSARTIEQCGGVFERVTYAPDGVVAKRRYWIAVPQDNRQLYMSEPGVVSS